MAGGLRFLELLTPERCAVAAGRPSSDTGRRAELVAGGSVQSNIIDSNVLDIHVKILKMAVRMPPAKPVAGPPQC
jgi:hypothetical protein